MMILNTMGLMEKHNILLSALAALDNWPFSLLLLVGFWFVLLVLRLLSFLSTC